MALAILHEEVEHEAWFSEYLSEGPSGQCLPQDLPHLRKRVAPLKRYAVEIR
jgi:hypothetical protein